MFYTQKGDNYLLRLVKGEKVIDSLSKFCEKNNIKNTVISGIGSIDSPTLAHYSVKTKKYSEKKLNGIFELTNLTGNVAQYEGKSLVHVHISLSDSSMHAFGGHLVETEVSATVEIILLDLKINYVKTFSQEIGLKLWDLPERL